MRVCDCARVCVRVCVCTCEAEGFESELGAVQDDEAVSLVQTPSRVLHIALKVPGLLPRTDLLNLPDVNWRDGETDTHTHTC